MALSQARRRALPRTVWALGFVSLFMDTSSELVHSLLPIFITATLSASMDVLGLIEGTAEAIAQVGKLASGWLSDKTAKRKAWILAGYGLSALTKPLFPLASGIVPVAIARFADRVGKGIRGAPRDAMLADVTPEDQRGAAYGLRQTLDTIGAVLGPLTAAGLLILYANDIRLALWWAVLPAFFCILTIVGFVREPERGGASRTETRPSFRNVGELPFAFWIAAAIAVVLTLARFSDAFLILRGTSLGVSLVSAPMILVLMNIVYALSSYPAGELSDRIGRRGLLALGAIALVAGDLTLGFAANFAGLGFGIALWGLHLGLTQGLLSAMVADSAPPRLRGTAFGLFYALTGVALLAASAIAGVLWDTFGAGVPFLAAAAVAALALLLLPAVGGRRAVNM
jgi:MFS family permease